MKEGRDGLPAALCAAVADFNAKGRGCHGIALPSHEPPGLRLDLDGVLDQDNSPAFLDLASLAMGEAQTSGFLVIGLSSLRHMSSMGVAVFADLLIEGKKLGVSLQLEGLADNIRLLFDVLGFSSYFLFTKREDRG